MNEFEALIALLDVTVKTLTLKKERMLQAAVGNYCTVTELANYFVRHDGISFRSAHNVVARLVGYMQDHGKLANEITREEVDLICLEVLGKSTTLTDELIKQALDPELNAQSKRTIGGSNKEEVLRQLTELKNQLGKDERVLAGRVEQINNAKALLEETTNCMTQGQ